MEVKKLQVSKRRSLGQNEIERRLSIPLIQKNNSDRTINDIAKIEPLLHRIPFLKNAIGDSTAFKEIVRECCKLLNLETYCPGEIIFNIQDSGDKFYIMLEGNASVYIYKNENDVRKDFEDLHHFIKFELAGSPEELYRIQEKLEALENEIYLLLNNSDQYAKRASAVMKRSDSLKNRSLFPYLRKFFNEKEGEEIMTGFINTEKFYLHIHNGYLRVKCVKKLKGGDYFGELALTFGTQRAATIFATSDLTLASLTKADYQRVFSKVNEKMTSKIEFFLPFTGTTSREGNLKCTYEFKAIKICHGNHFFKQGTKATACYIIEKGEVRVL